MKQVVKELFEKFRLEGMSPNEAAVRAMNEAKARFPGSSPGPR